MYEMITPELAVRLSSPIERGTEPFHDNSEHVLTGNLNATQHAEASATGSGGVSVAQSLITRKCSIEF